jgi:hypothetical protein
MGDITSYLLFVYTRTTGELADALNNLSPHITHATLESFIVDELRLHRLAQCLQVPMDNGIPIDRGCGWRC